MDNKALSITPEWLEVRGFALYTPGEEFNGSLPLNIDEVLHYNSTEDCKVYVEKELNRKQFAIIIEQVPDREGGTFQATQVFIQEDIGCEMVSIPDQFTEMTTYYFSLLYEAIRRDKLTVKTINVEAKEGGVNARTCCLELPSR